jgi:hypothetical protein
VKQRTSQKNPLQKTTPFTKKQTPLQKTTPFTKNKPLYKKPHYKKDQYKKKHYKQKITNRTLQIEHYKHVDGI